MARYQFTPQAEDDLLEIWTYIAKDNSQVADRVEATIYAACSFLANSPLTGRIRKELTRLPVRFWLLPSYPNYFIVYDPQASPLSIVRILHVARNIRFLLSQG